MTTSTIVNARQRREGARSTRPRVHGPRAAMEALKRETGAKSLSAAKAQIGRAWKVIDALLDAAREDPQVRDYLQRRFDPICARLHTDADPDLPALIDAKAAADATEDLHLQRLAIDPSSPEKRRRAMAALALEQRTGGELLAALETR